MLICDPFQFNKIYVRKESNEIINDFKPYFYAKDENGKYESIFGDKLTKIECKYPYQIPKKRENYEHFEADIQYHQRWIIDKLTLPLEKLPIHKLYWDIETYMSLDTKNVPEPIISISTLSNKINKFVTFIWRKDFKQKSAKYDKRSIYYFDNEKDMLISFMKYINDIDPDLLVGWNSDSFDYPYLYNRLCKLDLDPKQLSPIKNTTSRKIYGRVLFDMLKAWKILQPNKLENDKLDTVAKNLLSISKLPINIIEAYENNPEYLIKYNERDVELLLKIDENQGMINFFDEKRREFGVIWENIWFSSGIHDSVMIRKAKEKGIVLPSKKTSERGKVKGATVLSPKVGLHRGVIGLDVKSLYPNIIKTCNISPEKLDPNGDIIIGNGVRFTSKGQGFIPEIISLYLEKKDYYTKLMNQFNPNTPEYNSYYLKRWNYKIQANSFYGYLGFENGRLFNKDCFKSITFVGRKTIEFMKKVAEEKGYEVLYGDTDSVYVKVGMDKIIEKGKELTEEINKRFNDFIKQFGVKENKYLEVEFEKALSGIFFSASEKKGIATKKRYAYHEIYHDGKEVDKMNFTGFEIVRSDHSSITKKMQNDIFTMLIKEHKTKKDIDEYIKKLKKEIKERKYKWIELGIPSTVNKKKHVIRACKFSQKILNIDIYPNDRIFYIYGCIKNKFSTDIFAFKNDDDLKDMEVMVNWDKMFELLIDSKLKRIYDALGWDVIKQQKNIFDF